MILLKRAVIWLLARPAAQALLLDALSALARRTDNTVDDKVVAALRLGLVGKENPTLAAIRECDGYCAADKAEKHQEDGEPSAAKGETAPECDAACKVAKAVGVATQVAGAVKAVKDAVK